MALADLPRIAVVGADGVDPDAYVFRDGANGAFVITGALGGAELPAGVYVQSIEPIEGVADDLWIDTSQVPPVPKRFIDDGWVDLGQTSEGGDSLLALTAYSPDDMVTYDIDALGGALAEVDPGRLSITFTVPASGRVLIELEGMVDVGGDSELSWGLMDTGSVVAGPLNVSYNGNSAGFQITASRTFLVEGLVPGAVHTFDWAAYRSYGASAINMYAGETKGPAMMTASPAPAIETPSGPYVDAVLADAPLGFWLLNELAGGSARDISGNDNHGVYQSDPELAVQGPGEGEAALAVRLDGAAYIEVPAAPFRTPAFTAEAWVRTSQATWGAILAHPAGVSGPYGYNLFVTNSTGVLRAEYDGGAGSVDQSSDTAINDGKWHHIAMTADGDEVAVFIDGVEQDRAAQTGALDYLEAGPIAIGAQPTTGIEYELAGDIYGVALYDVALTEAQLAAHFDAMPAALLYEATFTDGALPGWTQSSTWTEDPANWITASGDASGQTFLRRAHVPGARYVETKLYQDGTGEQWACLRVNDINGAIYDNGCYGALIRGNGDIAVPWCAGSADVDDDSPTPPSPTEGDAVAFGIYIVDPTTVEVYVDGVMVSRQTSCIREDGNAYLSIGCFNGASAHFDYVRCYSKLPF